MPLSDGVVIEEEIMTLWFLLQKAAKMLLLSLPFCRLNTAVADHQGCYSETETQTEKWKCESKIHTLHIKVNLKTALNA